MAGAEADAALLLHPVDGGQQLARGSVPSQISGGVRQLSQLPQGLDCFAEVAEQPHAPAVGGFGQRQQRVELAAHHLLEVFAGRALVDHAALVHHVLQAVGHPGVGGQAVAAGAAGLLVVALDVLGHVQVGDEAHVRLVDAHAEGDGGHHHHAVLAQEAVLVALPHLGVQARVVGQGVDALLAQGLRDLLDPLARLAVDDAGLARVLALDEAQQLRRRRPSSRRCV